MRFRTKLDWHTALPDKVINLPATLYHTSVLTSRIQILPQSTFTNYFGEGWHYGGSGNKALHILTRTHA